MVPTVVDAADGGGRIHTQCVLRRDCKLQNFLIRCTCQPLEIGVTKISTVSWRLWRHRAQLLSITHSRQQDDA